jgi:predicted aspartyl protease/Flp pilus assembly protein TadD
MNFKMRKSSIQIQRTAACCLFIFIVSSISVFGISAEPRSTPETDAKSLRKQAVKFMKRGKFEEAEKAFSQAIGKSPENTELKLDLAYLYLKQKRLADDYKLAFPIADADAKNSYAYAIVGTILLGSGQFKEARPVLDTALTVNNNEPLAWGSLGLLEFYENNLSESLDCLREAVLRDGSEPDYLFSLAQVAGRLENFTESADAYRRFLRVARVDDKERRDRIVGIIKFLEFLGHRSSIYSLDGKDRTVIPLRIVNERPIIKVRLNNKHDFLDFVVDTGSGMTVISEETAKRLDIQPVTNGGVGSGIGGDGKFNIVFGFVRKVQIGDVSIRNTPVYIRKFHSNSEGIDGYIGLSLISKFLTTIDYGNGTFELEKAASIDQGNDRTAVPLSTNELPLRLTSSGFLSGEVVLLGDSEPLNFIVDTGASTTVLGHDIMEKHAFRKIERQGTKRVIGAGGIIEGITSLVIPSVRFGSNIQNDVAAIELDLGIINESSGYLQSGILGGNFLSKYKVTFDFQRSRVKLSPTVAEVTVDPAPLTQ